MCQKWFLNCECYKANKNMLLFLLFLLLLLLLLILLLLLLFSLCFDSYIFIIVILWQISLFLSLSLSLYLSLSLSLCLVEQYFLFAKYKGVTFLLWDKSKIFESVIGPSDRWWSAAGQDTPCYFAECSETAWWPQLITASGAIIVLRWENNKIQFESQIVCAPDWSTVSDNRYRV